MTAGALLALPILLSGVNSDLILAAQVIAGGCVSGGVYLIGFPVFVRQTLTRLSPGLERRVVVGLRAMGVHRWLSAYA